MLTTAVVRSVVPTVEPRSVVVAIVGGTMLTLALTRPRLRWVERMTEERVSVERSSVKPNIAGEWKRGKSELWVILATCAALNKRADSCRYHMRKQDSDGRRKKLSC
jgi:hypothetical protein